MKKRLAVFVMTLGLATGIGCLGTASDTAVDKDMDALTSEETVTETSDADDTSTNELGLLNSDMEKIYALIAYDLSGRDLDSSYFNSKDDKWWLDISTNISGLYSLTQMFSTSTYDSPEMMLYKLDGVEEDLILHNMFNVLTNSSQSSEMIESALKEHANTVSVWKDLFTENITFSDEQIQEGETLSKEFSEAE